MVTMREKNKTKHESIRLETFWPSALVPCMSGTNILFYDKRNSHVCLGESWNYSCFTKWIVCQWSALLSFTWMCLHYVLNTCPVNYRVLIQVSRRIFCPGYLFPFKFCVLYQVIWFVTETIWICTNIIWITFKLLLWKISQKRMNSVS